MFTLNVQNVAHLQKRYIQIYEGSIDGNQVSYETKVLNDVKDLLYKIEQRIYGMEVKIQDLQGSQNILEESLAYINKYLVENGL